MKVDHKKKKRKEKEEKSRIGGRKVPCTVSNKVTEGIKVSVLVQTVKETWFNKCL